jgi:L,D-transpeptidase catalytic domain
LFSLQFVQQPIWFVMSSSHYAAILRATFSPVTLLALGLGLGLTLALADPAHANVLISIDKNTQMMDVNVDGVDTYHWPVSTGRAGYDTPDGDYTPNRMAETHFSRQYDNAPMPHSIFFDLHGRAIHGTMETSGLGRAVSHGCVRLSPQNASVLYSLVQAEGMPNTKVVIAGEIPGGPSLPVTAQTAPQQRGPGWFTYPGYPGSAYQANDWQSWRAQRRAYRAWLRANR